MNTDKDIQMLVNIALTFAPGPTEERLIVVINLLNAIAISEKSDIWKKAGDNFMQNAVDARINDDSYFYTIVGTACLGRAVVLERLEKSSIVNVNS
jgi:hypothetical protein